MTSYKKWRRAIILAQCCWRRVVARKEFKQLKIQARSVDHLKQLNKGMENKIFSLQNKISELSSEKEKMNIQIKTQLTSIEQLNSKLEIFRKSDGDLKGLTDRLTVLENDNLKLTESIATFNVEKAKFEEIMSSKDVKISELESLNKELKDTVQSLESKISDFQSKVNEETMKEVQSSNEEKEQELFSTRERYQNLLHDYTRLEQRYENLQDEMKCIQKVRTGCLVLLL